jgi:hypothetical protein
VEPIDIWRSAKLMVDQYGNLALAECQRRSADFDAAGDGCARRSRKEANDRFWRIADINAFGELRQRGL